MAPSLDTVLQATLLDPSAPLPPTYAPALTAHLALFPNDTHFAISFEPGSGYGTVTCLERGCEMDIPLGAAKGRGGGKRIGFGELKHYHNHIMTHPTHSRMREERVLQLEQLTKKSVEKKKKKKRTSDEAELPVFSSVQGNKKTRIDSIDLDNMKMTREVGRVEPIDLEAMDMETPTRVTAFSREREANRLAIQCFETPPRATASTSSRIHPSTSAVTLDVLPPNSPQKPKLDKLIVMFKEAVEKEGQCEKEISDGIRYLSNEQIRALQAQVKSWQAIKELVRKQIGDGKANQILAATTGAMTPARPTFNANAIAGPSSVPNVNRHYPFTAIPSEGRRTGRTSLPSSNTAFGVATHAAVALLSGQAYLPDQFDLDDDDDYSYLQHRASGAERREELESLMKKAAEGDFEGEGMTVGEAMQKLGLDDDATPLPGSQINLMPHQILGVAWMLDQENSKNKGGILADEMGLGKTVQTIGLLVQNPPQDSRRRTTLIVAPLSLLDQWKNEIMQYADGLEVLIYHSSGTKVKTTKELQEYDVVLTNYETLRFQWPDDHLDELGRYHEPKEKKKKKRRSELEMFEESDGESEDVEKRERKAGILIKMKWYRVVLDEAHIIRNPNSLTSKAITRGLDAKYRWCLSGTPLINGLKDAFPLLKFIRLRVYSDWVEFNRHVMKGMGSEPGNAGQRLQVIFKSCMFRRRKTSTLGGKPILKLPPKVIEDVPLEFSEDERQIYAAVERREKAKFNKFLREGTVLKNFAQVLVMLLRLRQICNHPCLITEDMNPFELSAEDTKTEVARALQESGHDFVMRLKRMLRDRFEEKVEAEKKGKDVEVFDECPVCADTLENSYAVAPCAHIFCSPCLEKIWTSPPPMNDLNDRIAPQYAEEERACPTCRGPICRQRTYNIEAFEPSRDDMLGAKRLKTLLFNEEDSDSDDDGSLKDFIVDGNESSDVEWRPKLENNGKGVVKKPIIIDEIKMEINDEAEVDGAVFVKKMSSQEGKPVVELKGDKEIMKMVQNFDKMIPSTKMTWMLNTIKSWRATDPDDKVVVISQWTSCLDILANYLSENNIRHVSYTGDMKADERAEVVQKFQKGKIKYLLLSLKCGGVGLNLTKGNRIIHFDLAWSEAVEAQAFDRCHRIGQRKAVRVNRITIKQTVEERIKELQERKRLLVESSLGEGGGKKIGRLSVQDLCFLFGVA
ncbi:hypothetical protein BT69DRAFT_1270851 [Atractiella rhizophila]|nr:hypothetical protein BT69DRAFT_1270851 [Atractiella rhizophila]